MIPEYLSPGRERRTAGFALVDLATVLAVGSFLLALAVAGTTRFRKTARVARCTSNLHEIARALLLYCNDSRDAMPSGQSLASVELWWSYKEQIKKYVASGTNGGAVDATFACPDDRGYSDPQPFHLTERFDFNSYPLNAVTLPNTPSLAGWRLHDIKAPDKTLLVMEWCAHAPLSWHRSRTGKKNLPFYSNAESVVAFGDGHAGLTRIYYDGYNAAYTRDPIPGYGYKFSGN